MVTKLINLGLFITPFLVIPNVDFRTPKFIAATYLAVALSLLALYQGQIKPLKNKWIYILWGFILLSGNLAPKPVLQIFDLKAANFWIWQPLFHISMGILAIKAIAAAKLNFNDIINKMVWCGVVMAVFALLQAVGQGQFFDLATPKGGMGLGTQPHVSGTLSGPTLLAPYLGMIIPLAIYLGKKWKVWLMVAAVLATGSAVGIGCMVLSLLFYMSTKGIKYFKRAVVLFLLGAMLLTGLKYVPDIRVRTLMSDSGRIGIWTQLVKDVNRPFLEGSTRKFPLTGLGIGSFRYTFSTRHSNYMRQAHNEYLEIYYNCGLIGLVLFLLAIGSLIKSKYKWQLVRSGCADRRTMAILSSFICIALCAGGTFVWQLGCHIFYTLVLVGMLYNGGLDGSNIQS